MSFGRGARAPEPGDEGRARPRRLRWLLLALLVLYAGATATTIVLLALRSQDAARRAELLPGLRAQLAAARRETAKVRRSGEDRLVAAQAEAYSAGAREGKDDLFGAFSMKGGRWYIVKLVDDGPAGGLGFEKVLEALPDSGEAYAVEGGEVFTYDEPGTLAGPGPGCFLGELRITDRSDVSCADARAVLTEYLSEGGDPGDFGWHCIGDRAEGGSCQEPSSRGALFFFGP